MSIVPLPEVEIDKISASLEEYHKVFYIFWSGLNGIYFDDSIPTAAVRFNNSSKPDLLLGKDFWENLSDSWKLFVIFHECLHIMLDHGMRTGSDIPGYTPALANEAQDITINHIIEDMFGLGRKLLPGWQKYCWIETSFEDSSKILSKQEFRYYLEQLVTNKSKTPPSLFDSHETQPQSGASKKIAEELIDAVETGTLQKMKDTVPGIAEGIEHVIKARNKKVKLSIKQLIKGLKKTKLTKTDVEKSSFAFRDRRFNALGYDKLLPGKTDVRTTNQDKLSTVIFMDVSGSCVHEIQIFHQMIEAFQKERVFEVTPLVFDVSVREYSPHMKVGGGTSFYILEQHLQNIVNSGQKYPDCVIVITDGDGNQVNPKYPNRWVWILIEPAMTYYINKASKKFLKEDVVFE